MTHLTAIELDEIELDVVLKHINQPDPKQAARICAFLAFRAKAPTLEVNSTCSVGNISDVVNKDINPKIYHLGLMVGCEKPIVPIQNKFDQPSGQFLWSFFRLPEAANDPVYKQDKS
jgi:hypothetical protein